MAPAPPRERLAPLLAHVRVPGYFADLRQAVRSQLPRDEPPAPVGPPAVRKWFARFHGAGSIQQRSVPARAHSVGLSDEWSKFRCKPELPAEPSGRAAKLALARATEAPCFLAGEEQFEACPRSIAPQFHSGTFRAGCVSRLIGARDPASGGTPGVSP